MSNNVHKQVCDVLIEGIFNECKNGIFNIFTMTVFGILINASIKTCKLIKILLKYMICQAYTLRIIYSDY